MVVVVIDGTYVPLYCIMLYFTLHKWQHIERRVKPRLYGKEDALPTSPTWRYRDRVKQLQCGIYLRYSALPTSSCLRVILLPSHLKSIAYQKRLRGKMPRCISGGKLFHLELYIGVAINAVQSFEPYTNEPKVLP
jgi:hypothetical protein